MPSLFTLKDFAAHARLRWTVLALVLSIVALFVFVSCLRAESTTCTTTSAIMGLVSLCLATWHGLIYIAQRRGGF